MIFLLFSNLSQMLMRFLSIETLDIKTLNSLLFLDILVNNNESNLQTSVFQKKTHTGLLSNYFSFVPNCYELDLIKTLVDRMYRINNSWASFL